VRVRISWFGEGARLAAWRLQQWLPSLLPSLDIQVADHRPDVPARERLAEVRAPNFTIFVVGPEPIESPWLGFEVGILAATHRPARVWYLAGLPPSPLGPMACFEHSPWTEDGLRQTILHLARVADEPIPRLEANLHTVWPMIGGLPLGGAELEGFEALDAPTIARGRRPSLEVSAPDATELAWVGQYRGYRPGDSYALKMSLRLSTFGTRFVGQAHFEGPRNAVLDVHGERTRSVDEGSTAWRQQLRHLGPGAVRGLLYFWDAQAFGDRLEVGGIYRCVQLKDGGLQGLWFRSGQAEPIGEFELSPAPEA